MAEPVSPMVMTKAAAVLEVMRVSSPQIYQIAATCDSSMSTAYRAIKWLRGLGAPIVYDRGASRWRLTDRSWRLPVFELRPDGFSAAGMNERGAG